MSEYEEEEVFELEDEEGFEAPQYEEDVKKLAQYFLHQIAIAKKQRESFWKRGEKAIKEYLGEYPNCDDELLDERRLNIFNSIINTSLPAYYSRTPKSEVSLRKKLGNALDSIGAQAIENGSQYCLEECQDPDEVALQAIKSFLLVGQGVLWERYEAETEEVVEQLPVLQGPDGAFVFADGSPVEGEIQVDEETGGFFVTEQYERLVSEKSITEFVHYKDYLQSPARYESEVEWKARRLFFSKAEYQETFKNENELYVPVDQLAFSTLPEELKELNLGKDAEKEQGKLAVWELWSERKGLVLYLCEEYEDGPLMVTEPPVKLRGFYPCAPALLANVAQDQSIPVCDHHIIKDLLKEVERITTRLHACAEAIRVTAAYDKNLGDLISDLFGTDFEFVPIDDFKAFAEKGSLADRILFTPLEPYVNAMQVLGQMRNEALQKIYEVTGSSDIMRGATDARETAAAQQIKGTFANLRFSLRQRQIQNFLAQQLKIKAEIMCTLFSDETLYEICKGEELERQLPKPQPQPGPDGQPMPLQGPTFAEVLAYIRSPYKHYKIDIETDSMVALDESAEREQITNYLNSIGQLLSQTLPAIQQYPSMAELFMEYVDMANGAYRKGKRLDSLIESLLPRFVQEVQQARAQADQQQQQDPKMMESQTKMQIAQMEAQTDQMQAQMEMQKAQMEAQLKQMELQAKMEEIKLKREQLQLEAAQTQVNVKHEAEKQNLEYKILELSNRLQQTEASISLMDQIARAPVAQSAGGGGAAAPTLPEITINLPTGKKLVKYVDGGAVIAPLEG